MPNDLEARYLDALELVTLADLAERGTKAYRTLQAYRRGERRVTEEAVRELVVYLRGRAQSLTAAADRLEAALDQGGDVE